MEQIKTSCPKECDTIEKINEWYRKNVWSKINPE